jgi:DeoR/GlpR family transcriptional regulator of sugar metabolism
MGTVFVDAGTTCLEVGRALLDRPALRIFTNSVPLLGLAAEARATVSAVGGEVRPMSLALTGGLAQSWLENLRFDVAVVGASGLEGASGASTTEVAEAAVKAEALRRARRRILVAHAEKWGRPAALRFAPWSAFTDVVTDRALSRDERAALNAAQVRVHAVPSR